MATTDKSSSPPPHLTASGALAPLRPPLERQSSLTDLFGATRVDSPVDSDTEDLISDLGALRLSGRPGAASGGGSLATSSRPLPRLTAFRSFIDLNAHLAKGLLPSDYCLRIIKGVPRREIPLAACECPMAPLAIRDRFTDIFVREVRSLFSSPDKRADIVWFGSGRLGNETVMSEQLIHAGHNHLCFHLVDHIYGAEELGIRNLGEAAVEAFHLKTQLERSRSEYMSGREIFSFVRRYVSARDFQDRTPGSSQVFAMVDPAKRFSFESTIARDFLSCVDAAGAKDKPRIVMILANRNIYLQKINPGEARRAFTQL